VKFLGLPAVRTCVDPLDETLGWPVYYGNAFSCPTGGVPVSAKITHPGEASTGFFTLGGAKQTLYVAARHTDGLHVQMRYGIPGYRIPREQLAAELNRIVDMGVEVKTHR